MAGRIQAGGICAYTLSDETEDLTAQEFVAFLEPAPERGPALCLASSSFANIQIALEQACRKLGKACTKEMAENIKKVSSRLERLKPRRADAPAG